MACGPAMSQIFIMDDDVNNRGELPSGSFGVMVPEQNVNYDQFVPVDGGVLLLAGLAGAYLFGKRRKHKNEG